MKKITSFLMLFLLIAGTVLAQEKPQFVKSLDDINLGWSYTLTAPRSALCVSAADAAAVQTIHDAQQTASKEDVRQQFAFVKSGSNYYLYSVAAKKYVNNDKSLSSLPKHPVSFETGNPYKDGNATKNDRPNAVKIKMANDKIFNIGGSSQFVIDGWNTTDVGNSFYIEHVADIEPIAFYPFKLSTLTDGQFGNQMVWYTLKMNANDNRLMQLDGDNLHAKQTVPGDKSHYFAFVKDATEGVLVYNYKTGADKIMWVADGNDATPVKMTAKKDAQVHPQWTVGGNGNGFYLKSTQGELAYVNRYGGSNNTQLKIWANSAAANDGGSRFVFEEPDILLPEVGKKYFLYCDHQQGKQYFYDNEGQMGWATATEKYKKYVWTCVQNADGTFALRNYGTGKYYGWQSISNDAYNWTLSSKNQVVHADRQNVTLYSNAEKRYLVCAVEGEKKFFDRAQSKFDDQKFCSDFHFEECKLADNEFIAANPTEYFTAAYGEKWIRLGFYRDGSYSAGVNGEAANSEKANFGDAEQVWSMVGSATSFKLYNKAKGESVALSVADANEATPATFVPADQAVTWKLVEKDFGAMAIVPNLPIAGDERTLNAFGGAGKDLKLYTTADEGGWWKFQIVVEGFTMSVQVEGVNPYPATNNRAGDLKMTVNGAASWSTISGNVDAITYYLPAKASVSLEQSFEYRGFRKGGFEVDGVHQDNLSFTLGSANQPKQIVSKFMVAPERGQYLYKTPGLNGHPYRIPAIMTAVNGDILAISDFRPAGADIGYGEVDIKCRISQDNGETWGEEFFIADGHGKANATNDGPWDYGFGDAAVVADCERNEVLIMMVCGKTVCWNGNYDPKDPSKSPNRVARVRGHFDYNQGKWVFTKPVEVTNDIYPLFDNPDHQSTTVQSLFIGSGRICQSRVTKVGKYYRLYCAVWTKNEGNRVIYSDDFGESWKVLGGIAARPAKGGDEPKCEEMPNGDVILSSRNHGRVFNIYQFSNKVTGEGKWQKEEWSEDQQGGISVGNNTNGEIMLFNAIRQSDQAKVVLAVQSIPFGGGRNNVGFYYKEITPEVQKNSKALASNWTKGMQVSHVGSAYSTMTLQKDLKIGFFFEENPNDYCQVYIPLTLDEITKENYLLDKAQYTNIQVNTHDAKNLECALSSFSASYPTTPDVEGVKAFYAKSSLNDFTGEEPSFVITMTEVPLTDGKLVVPAHTGVLLQTKTAQQFNMAKSAVAGPKIKASSNMLLSTEDTNLPVPTEFNVFILSGDADGNAGFFKLVADASKREIARHRAFLSFHPRFEASKLDISFGEVTGIEGTEVEDAAESSIYDLSGRRVKNVDKGGVYIQKGHKFIVK